MHGRVLGLMTAIALLAIPALGAPQLITPRQAIEKAADAAPLGVDGTFDMLIRGSGHQDGYTYLNSEDDYRDQRNLTVAIPPGVASALKALYGEAPETYFKGKHIQVSGQAMRVKILFFCSCGESDKYYYQTHVALTDPNQLQVAK